MGLDRWSLAQLSLVAIKCTVTTKDEWDRLRQGDHVPCKCGQLAKRQPHLKLFICAACGRWYEEGKQGKWARKEPKQWPEKRHQTGSITGIQGIFMLDEPVPGPYPAVRWS